MKQHITKEQWDELDIKKQCEFRAMFTDFDIESPKGQRFRPSIGQMIEFLDGYLRKKYLDNDYQTQLAWYRDGAGYEVFVHEKVIYKEELADALWEAVKTKLK